MPNHGQANGHPKPRFFLVLEDRGYRESTSRRTRAFAISERGCAKTASASSASPSRPIALAQIRRGVARDFADTNTARRGVELD